MEGSELLVQFDHEDKEADDDEPLLQLHSGGKDADDSQPLAQVQHQERNADDNDDDDEPVIQLHFKDYEGDLSSRNVVKDIDTAHSSGHCLKAAFAFLVAVTTVALLIALLGLILSAAGLKATSPLPTIQPATSPTTSRPTTTPTPTIPPVLVTQPNCGSGMWQKVAYFDMTDPSQQCPRGFRGYDSPVRCCGRPVSSRESSPSVYYSTGGCQYSIVCGRVIGYQVGSPDCFHISNEPEGGIVNGIYVDGVSITHGNPRSHIWTFAVGLHEFAGVANDQFNCPCDGGTTNPPAFVGSNYFCETGDDTPNVELHRFYDGDPLWDGSGCHNATCCSKHSPPWFKVWLASPTTDDIEVRICGDQSTGDEDTPIALLEIYVQ